MIRSLTSRGADSKSAVPALMRGLVAWRRLRHAGFAMAMLLCSLCLLAGTNTGTKLTVQVNSVDTGKPIDRASVIIRFRHGLNPVKMRKIRTSWETKTNQMGSVTVPEIPMGQVTIQIIAEHYQTFGDVFELTMPDQTIAIKLNPPQAQYSEDSKTK